MLRRGSMAPPSFARAGVAQEPVRLEQGVEGRRGRPRRRVPGDVVEAAAGSGEHRVEHRAPEQAGGKPSITRAEGLFRGARAEAEPPFEAGERVEVGFGERFRSAPRRRRRTTPAPCSMTYP